VHKAEEEWLCFLERVREARVQLFCSTSSAWFRGQTAQWSLRPKLLREYVLSELAEQWPIVKDSAKNPFPPGDAFFLKLFRLLDQRPALKLHLPLDQFSKLNSLLEAALKVKVRLRRLGTQIRSLNSLTREMRRVTTGSNNIPKVVTDDELFDICAENQIPIVPPKAGSSLDSSIKQLDPLFVSRANERLQLTEENDKKALAEVLQQIRWTLSVGYGERDRFTEFNFRWHQNIGNPWEVLARMQHYKVSTRLLDWTEVLGSALVFALENFIDLYVSKTKASKKGIPPSLDDLIEESREYSAPCVFILNPYVLTRLASGKNAINDLTVDKELDYLDRFFGQGWPYERPLPIYSPWREARISSQLGMFTVHGTDLRPLEKQVGPDCVQMIEMSVEAAVAGARHVASFLPTDKFSRFQDMDSLGFTVEERFSRTRPP
jgi:hypothetical protein